MLAIRHLFLGVTTSLANDRPRSQLVRGVIALAAGAALLTGTAARAGDPTPQTTVPNGDIFATGGLFGGATQTHAVCYAFNGSEGTDGGTIPKITLRIRGQNGATVTGGTRNCGAVTAGGLCSVTVSVAANKAYSCTMFAKGPNGVFARGTLEFRDAGDGVTANSNLQ
jgi:hypothetical protein